MYLSTASSLGRFSFSSCSSPSSSDKELSDEEECRQPKVVHYPRRKKRNQKRPRSASWNPQQQSRGIARAAAQPSNAPVAVEQQPQPVEAAKATVAGVAPEDDVGPEEVVMGSPKHTEKAGRLRRALRYSSMLLGFKKPPSVKNQLAVVGMKKALLVGMLSAAELEGDTPADTAEQDLADQRAADSSSLSRHTPSDTGGGSTSSTLEDDPQESTTEEALEVESITRSMATMSTNRADASSRSHFRPRTGTDASLGSVHTTTSCSSLCSPQTKKVRKMCSSTLQQMHRFDAAEVSSLSSDDNMSCYACPAARQIRSTMSEDQPKLSQIEQTSFASLMFDRNAPKIPAKALLNIPLRVEGTPPLRAKAPSNERPRFQRGHTIGGYGQPYSCDSGSESNSTSNSSGSRNRKSLSQDWKPDELPQPGGRFAGGGSAHDAAKGQLAPPHRCCSYAKIPDSEITDYSSDAPQQQRQQLYQKSLKYLHPVYQSQNPPIRRWARRKSSSLNLPEPASILYQQYSGASETRHNSLPIVILSPAPPQLSPQPEESDSESTAKEDQDSPHRLRVPNPYGLPAPAVPAQNFTVSRPRSPLQRQENVDRLDPEKAQSDAERTRRSSYCYGLEASQSSEAAAKPKVPKWRTFSLRKKGAREYRSEDEEEMTGKRRAF